MFNLFNLSTRTKLVDDKSVQALNKKIEEVKRSYRPEQGWLLAKENEVKLSR
jgi:hypothetical protein